MDAVPSRRLVTTWSFRRGDALRHDPPSRVTWEIEPLGEACQADAGARISFPGETPTFRAVGSGWPLVLSSLKESHRDRREPGAGVARVKSRE